MSDLEVPYESIVDGLFDGAVVPFFGAAASAVCREENAEAWEPGKTFFPFGHELAAILARASGYKAAQESYRALVAELSAAGAKAGGVSPEAMETALEPVLRRHVGGPPGLALIASWFVHVQSTRDALNRKLRTAFEVTREPGELHKRIAGFEATRLYMTTNYDDLLECALAAREPHVLVDRQKMGLALRAADGALEPIDRTGTDLYRLDDPKTKLPSRPILFKMHGSIDRKNRRNESYLITEEDYVDYLGRDGGNYIPPYIHGLMQGKTLLFLGYSLEDWNVRVILRKLLTASGGGGESARCWAIVRGRSEAEQKVWQSQGLNIYPMDLMEFSRNLATEIERRH